MQISTKTLASLLVVTSVGIIPAATRRSGRRKKSRFERLLRRHDRKGELRAELLGISPQAFRDELKHGSLDEVVRRHGFLNEQAFRRALLGKIRQELRLRGWSIHKINTYITARSDRLG